MGATSPGWSSAFRGFWKPAAGFIAGSIATWLGVLLTLCHRIPAATGHNAGANLVATVIGISFVIWAPAILGGVTVAFLTAALVPAPRRARLTQSAVCLAFWIVIALWLSRPSSTTAHHPLPPAGATPLIAAVVNRDLDRTRELLVTGADPNALVANRSALIYVFSVYLDEDPEAIATLALATGNLPLFWHTPSRKHFEISKLLREYGALARDDYGLDAYSSKGQFEPQFTSPLRLNKLEVSPTAVTRGQPLTVTFTVTNTGSADVVLPRHAAVEPPGAFLGWTELKIVPKHERYVVSIPRVILLYPSDRVAPGQGITTAVTVFSETSEPGPHRFDATFFPNVPSFPTVPVVDPMSFEQGPRITTVGDFSSMSRAIAVEVSPADSAVSLCSVSTEAIRTTINFAAAAVAPGQLASLFVVCPEQDAARELFRDAVLFESPFLCWQTQRLRGSAGTFAEADLRVLEAAASRVMELERQTGRINGSRKWGTRSLARAPLSQVVTDRDAYQKGGPARAMDRFRPLFQHEGHHGAIGDLLRPLLDPGSSHRGPVQYDAKDLEVLDQMLAQASQSLSSVEVGILTRDRATLHAR